MTDHTPAVADISLRHLSVGYRDGRHAVRTVLTDIDVQERGGQFVCLMGRNGSGKSTLLRTLAALQPPLAGTASIAGHDTALLTPRDRARLVAVVLTRQPDVTDMTAREMVATGRTPYTGFWGSLSEADDKAVDEALTMTGTLPLAHRPFARLSDGERQKVMVAKALAQQTPVILLDEPAAYLDFTAKVDLMRLLLGLAHKAGKTIIASTHDFGTAVQLADRLWIAGDGRLAIGTPRSMAADGTLARFVEGDGVVFDAETLAVQVSRE